MGNIVDASPRARLLPGWDNADLHPNVVEALKVFADAQQQFVARRANINSQYLKSLGRLGADEEAQADAVRGLMGL